MKATLAYWLLPLATTVTAGFIDLRLRDPYALNYRTTPTNGSCIGAPEDACTSLVGLCVAKVASGQIAKNALWSDPVCFAAAVCAGSAQVVDAACCAGSCTALNAMISLDYTNVYAPMVGSCAWQSGGCPVTWTDFVNYFYNTIQATGTNDWPTSGDTVLGWWAEIAQWTGFCAGTNCVNGQIPYLNLNDWLHYMWSTLISTPGNPPITSPPSTNRDNNTDVWDPPATPMCPFDDITLCGDDNAPPDPPDAQALAVRSGFYLRATESAHRPQLFGIQLDAPLSSIDNSVNLSRPLPIGFAHFQPGNAPPPVFIHGGAQQVHLNLNTTSLRPHRPPPGAFVPQVPHGRPERGPNGTANASREITATRVQELTSRALTQDTCKGAGIEAPNPLPTLTYYCDYLPSICEGIRDSGKFTGNTVQLTYDPYNSGARRNSVCTKAQKAAIQAAGGCDPFQHDPAYWKVSCDEFPMNSVLEGGAKNGAGVVGVPEIEQSYQSSLQSALSRLFSKANNKQTQWSKTGSQSSKNPGKCHSWVLQLSDTRPAGASATGVGSLDTGGAFLKGKTARATVEITNSRAKPPPAPLNSWTDYSSQSKALQPTKSYRKFDCSPGGKDEQVQCMDTDSDTKKKRQQCSASPPSQTPDPPQTTQAATEDASDSAAAAAASAAAAQSALNSIPANSISAAQAAAAAAAVSAASAAAAAAAALAPLTNPADIAAGLEAATSFLDTAQSAVAALTSIFSFGTPGAPAPPAAIASIIGSTAATTSAVASTIAAMWNVKPPNVAPVPPAAAPGQDPFVNSPKPGAPAAGCFPAGSHGFIKLGSNYLINANGNAPATLTNAGSNAYFGLSIPNPTVLVPVSGCSGVYTWGSGGPQPDFQVDCSTHEFQSFWNGNKLQCFYYPDGTNVVNGVTYYLVGIMCGSSVSQVYSCAQTTGVYASLNSALFTWTTS